MIVSEHQLKMWLCNRSPMKGIKVGYYWGNKYVTDSYVMYDDETMDRFGKMMARSK